jgi:hypothetical protein
VDQLPAHIRNSKILTSNDLGMLAGVDKLPSQEEINEFLQNGSEVSAFLDQNRDNQEEIHTYAQQLIEQGKVDDAWKVLLTK